MFFILHTVSWLKCHYTKFLFDEMSSSSVWAVHRILFFTKLPSLLPWSRLVQLNFFPLDRTDPHSAPSDHITATMTLFRRAAALHVQNLVSVCIYICICVHVLIRFL